MNPNLSIATIIAILLVVSNSPGASPETLKDLLNRYDKNGDGVLSKKEFDEALKENGVRVITPAGAKREAAALQLFNRTATKYPNAPLKYLKRMAQAHFLTNPPKAVRDLRATALRENPSALESFDRLTTYEKFIVRRARGDLQTLKPDIPEALPETFDPITTFFESNFRVRDEMEGIAGEAVSDNPAKFTWTHSKGQDDFYTINLAVLYTPSWLNWRWDRLETDKPENRELHDWIFGGRIRPAFEAHVSTQTGAARDELKYAILFEGRIKYFPGEEANIRTIALPAEDLPLISVHHFALAPVYVTDRVASVRSWGLDALYEPSVPYLNLNHDNSRRLLGLSWLEGSMKGSLGLAFREYDQGKPVAMHDNDYGLFVGHIEIALTVFGRLKLSADYSANTDLWGNMKSHDLFQGSAEVMVDKKNHFTVGATYVHGEEEPMFEKVDSITAWVGVKF
jgi:hypothetical protein